MNICLVYWYYLPNYGGIQTLMQTLAEGLIKNKHKVFILCGPNKGSPNHEVRNGINITRTNYLSRTIKTNQKKRIKYLNEYIKKNKIDLLHINNFQRPHAPSHTKALYQSALKNEIPIILHIHIPITNKKETKLINKYDWNNIISISNFVSKGIIIDKHKRKKIKRLPNCIDVKKFREELINNKHKKQLTQALGIKERKPIVLMPTRLLNSRGQFEERKGIKEFIKALALAKNKGLDFYGIITALEHESFPKKSKKTKEILKNLSKELGLGRNLIIPKNDLKQKLMPALYSLSDIVVIPSVNEAFGIVALEGMASGKPVIGTTSGALPEIIEHKKTGILVKPKSSTSLFNALDYFLSNKINIMNYGKNGRQRVKERYSNEKIVKDLINIYQKLR